MRVYAQQNDTVDQLCLRHLGRTDGVVEAVLAGNPGLAEHGPHLPIGTAVDLPDTLPATTARTIQLWD